ncbi:ABC transporter ATP-binding protein [Raineyella sp. LH-20]|uniref:ABC transporter ATP-binding protein n=1 Tax=Raineyella sp. LH-20 TaxID=3081204 RepID=UPI0029559DBD|nr:ABC transporter ATP-binding protein [Raineyella sp. LH-20]WOP17966.1 ABC transporter ATP-binding protein [Raineyella sp. LH-20]
MSTTTVAPVIRTHRLTKRYGELTALDRLDLAVPAQRIVGLLGRNGAGKTTLMQVLTGQIFPDDGEVEVFGESPAENPRVLGRVSFVAEAQKYPTSFHARHVLAVAPWFFPGWDADLAASLVDSFRLPLRRPIVKLSRGELSMVGIIVGLASRAPLTFFDEPYLGLDAVARQLFYDVLLADYAERPRTIVISTHLIDEISPLLDHILLIDRGRLLLDADAEVARGSTTVVSGATSAVDRFVEGRTVLARHSTGPLARATVGESYDALAGPAAAAGLSAEPVTLQQLLIDRTAGSRQGRTS